MTVYCYFCGEPVDPNDRATWRSISGWERSAGVRASGKHGGSDIVLRAPTGGYAHPFCIDRTRDGVNVRQETLV